MPEEEKVVDTSAQSASEEDSKTVAASILGKETEEKSEEKAEEETEKKDQEKLTPEEKAEAKPEEEAKALEADEEAKIAEILARFKGTSEEVSRQIAKAYHNQGEMHGKQDGELGDLRKEVINWRQFQEDFAKDSKGTIERLQKQAETEESEKKNIIEEAYTRPEALDEYIDEKFEERETRLKQQQEQEQRMKDTYPDWDKFTPQRKALLDAIKVKKLAPEEILHLAVRGPIDPKKLFSEAKDIVRKEENEALVKKMEQQVDKQTGGEEEKTPPSDSRVVSDTILTESEKARR